MKPRHPETEPFDAYDVLVAGGGPAGVCAALAAARRGARTLLLERFNCLGGIATAGLHQKIAAFTASGGAPDVVGGLPREIADRAVADWGASRRSHGLFVEIEGFKCLLDDMAEAAGVDLLYYTLVADACVQEGAVRGVVFQNKDGRFLAEAGCVIDATGDADVAFRAGAETVHGRPQDGRMQPVTLMYRVGGIDCERVHTYRKDDPKLETFCRRAAEEGLMRPWQTQLMGFWWIESRPDQLGINFTHMHLDGASARDMTAAAVEGRRQTQEAVRAMRALIPGFEDAYLIDTAQQIGVRETRRIVGEVTIGEDDIRNQTVFDDSIGIGSEFIDIHNVEGPGLDKRAGFRLPKGGYYTIPYRTLVPRAMDGLLVAGRCHSATHEAAGSTRWMTQCMVMGQAAGTAAQLALEKGVAPRAVDVEALQRRLEADGAILR